MYSYGSPHTAAQKQDDQHERTFSSYVRIQVVVLKTYLGRWTIGRSGERGSGISVLPARYDDDDIYIYIYIEINMVTWGLYFWHVLNVLVPFQKTNIGFVFTGVWLFSFKFIYLFIFNQLLLCIYFHICTPDCSFNFLLSSFLIWLGFFV